ncbi:MAG: hypothetical protein ACYC5K_10985 [Saccharofermentanales bacterium]
MSRRLIVLFITILAAASLLLLPSCGILPDEASSSSGNSQSTSSNPSDSGDLLDPADFEPTPAPTDWSMPGMEIHHVDVEPVALGDVPVRVIDLPDYQPAQLIHGLPDGGCLAAVQVAVNEKDASSNPSYFLKVIRFGPDGAVRWEKKYESHPFSGYTISLCVLPDDGFAAALRITEVDGDSAEVFDRLMRFSPEGEVLWVSGNPSLQAGVLDQLFAMADGRLLAAGSVGIFDDTGTQTGTCVGIMRFEVDGRISVQKVYGSAAYDSLIDAAYSTETGLALAVWSQVPDSGGSDGAFKNSSAIVKFDENLEAGWKFDLPDGETIFELRTLPKIGSTLALGSMMLDKPTDTGIDRRSMVFLVDGEGAKSWSYTVRKDFYNLLTAARLEDGRFIAGEYAIDSEGKEVTDLIVLSDAGTESSIIENLPGTITQIIPTLDGGFTAVFVQAVRPLPQPPYISSLWTDTETIVSHYSSTLEVAWRRTIDRFKHSTRGDVIVPTADERLLVG